jgi:hypothetical protein
MGKPSKDSVPVPEPGDDPLAAVRQVLAGDTFSESALEGSAVVPKSDVAKSLTAQDFGDALNKQIMQADSLGKGVAVSKVIKHHDPSRFAAIKDALAVADETYHGPSSVYTHDGYEVKMPAEVSQRPNQLYEQKNHNGRVFKLKGEQARHANALFGAFFGDESPRVLEAAKRCGFEDNPLVLVSQKLFDYLANDVQLDWAKYAAANNDPGWDEACDENGDSDWIKALYKVFYFKTVKELARLAKYKQIGIITALRCIMSDVATKRGIPLMGTEEYDQIFGKKRAA